jgi:hypothetical protein
LAKLIAGDQQLRREPAADPETHIAKIQELRQSGVTIVNIHSGQPDLKRVIEFYGSKVLPKVRRT